MYTAVEAAAILLTCVGVPLLLAHLQDHARRSDRRADEQAIARFENQRRSLR